MDLIPLHHEFGRILNSEFHHFEALKELMAETQQHWRGCGSYLIDGTSLEYTPLMYEKQCALFDSAKVSTHAVEIGVHGGHSLLIMLLANPTLHITCNDICLWEHTERCVEYLQSAFPQASITLWKGASLDVLPQIVQTFKDLHVSANLVHIDGAHEIQVIEQEMRYVLQVMPSGATLIFDDYSTPELSHAIHNTWSHLLKVVSIPACHWTHCITNVL